MDFRTPSPGDAPYQLGMFNWFWMPTAQGSTVRAVAVPIQESNIWIAAYTLLLILIFVALARIIKDIVIAVFPLRGNGNRYAMLVGYSNTNDPVSIMFLAGAYCWKTLFRVRGDGRWGIDWSTFWLGVGLIVVSILLLAANAAGGVLVARNLRLGNVALVKPGSVFLPWTSDPPDRLEDYLNWQRFQGPEAFRSVADLDQMDPALKNKFTFEPLYDRSDPDRPNFSLNYTYEVSGYDFGLQRAPALLYKVKGSCETRYDWIADQPDPGIDRYFLFGNSSDLLTVNNTRESTYVPYAEFINSESTDLELHPENGVAFLIVPHTAGRRSTTANSEDPWYLSEPIPGSRPQSIWQYRVRPKRPPLWCVQWDTWEFKGKEVMNVLNLGNLVEQQKGLHLSKMFTDELFLSAFASPPIVTIGNALGMSALASSLYNIASSRRLDLELQSLGNDTRRLVQGSFIYSRDTVRTTARQPKSLTDGLPNAITKQNFTDHEIADFVLPSSDVTTMSVNILLATPAVCLLLWIFIWLSSTCLFTNWWGRVRNDSYRARYLQRTIGFSSIQLYKYLDEEVSGERRWVDRLSFYPYIKDVSERYIRQRSNLEVIPTSARSDTSALSPTPSIQKPTATVEEEELGTVPLYGSSTPPPTGDNGAATDDSMPLATRFVRPALVPLHERRSSAPDLDNRFSNASLGTLFSAQRRRPTSEYVPRTDAYELVLTQHWRPSLRPDDNVHWKQVARE
ncbi:hypothetical protein FN846DRAFT_605378 [Sphaerosporella brunnea]|uniref:Uncharacterized protein n=1 Tax=Sphaerosporella brunnea TaxID=1250544 RepID=A0A5J5F0Q6_9PEZI|nr:hypothetical protein FN846DRAFT_605378 [Sphaerosporella brunnea]